MLRSRASTALTMLDLPAPEGAATMKRVPRMRVRSFDVLDLFADLVDQHLELDRRLRGARVDRLGAQRVGLAVEFLQQEVEPAADRLRVSCSTRRASATWLSRRSSSSSTSSFCSHEHQFLLEPARVERLREVGQARFELAALARRGSPASACALRRRCARCRRRARRSPRPAWRPRARARRRTRRAPRPAAPAPRPAARPDRSPAPAARRGTAAVR